MIRIKVYKLSQIIGAAVIALLVLIAVIVGVSVFAGGQKEQPITTDMAVQTASTQVDVPAPADKPGWLEQLRNRFLRDSAQALSRQLPLDPMALPVTADAGQGDQPDDVDRIRVEIAGIEGKFAPEPVDRPRVLIYHTHSYEAFAQDADNPYEETTQWRSADRRFNIMGVGDRLASELEALGVEVVHDVTEHEPPKLGTAYMRSLDTLEKYAEAGERFDMMIDLHRDAASARNTKPSCVSSGGRQYARLMMLIGTGEGDDGNGFSIKPNWKENYKLAEALTEGLNQEIPNLCRDVMVKTGRYNQHMSERAVLIEVGHNENTLEQALNATEPLAQVIARLLLGDG